MPCQAGNELPRVLDDVADALPAMVSYWDRDLICRYANHAYGNWFGKSPKEILGMSFKALLGEEMFATSRPFIAGVLAGQAQQFECSQGRSDGSLGHLSEHYIARRDATGSVVGFYALVSDVTALKNAEAERELAASIYRTTREGIIVTDAKETILSVNPAFTEITGYAFDEIGGQSSRLLKSFRHDASFYATMRENLLGAGHWQGETWIRAKGGQVILVWQSISRIQSTGQPVRYVSLFHDVTDVRQHQERIRHMAFHDALTDLPNRSLFMERLERLIAITRREQRNIAILFLDLDRFKSVNDSLGHAMGDQLLKATARRLEALIRRSDTVARLGGDEFVILLDNPSSRTEVAQIAGHLVKEIRKPVQCQNRRLEVGVSVGIAMHPCDGLTPEELMSNADTALYAAKVGSDGGYRFFEAAMSSLDVRRVDPTGLQA